MRKVLTFKCYLGNLTGRAPKMGIKLCSDEKEMPFEKRMFEFFKADVDDDIEGLFQTKVGLTKKDKDVEDS